MNILYINHYAGSPRLGMEFRPYCLAKEWIKLGHNVTILAGDYSHLRKENPKVISDFSLEAIDGINYCWIKTGTYNGNGAKRAISMVRFVKKLYFNARKITRQYQPDIVIASSTYPIDTFAAQKIAKLSKAQLIHEVHDMWPATLYEIGGMSKKNPFVLLMQIGENSAYKRSDYVVSVLPLAKEYMIQHGMNEEKFVNISNGFDFDGLSNSTQLPTHLSTFLKTEKQNGKFIVGYCGGHALSNALNDFIIAASKINNDNIDFILVGDGTEKQKLIENVKRLKIANVYFFPPIEKLAVPILLEYFDCGYVGANPSPLYRFGVSPNKIYDYMAASLPIICAISTPKTPVSESGAGICLESGDVMGIVNAIDKLYKMSKEERTCIGRLGYESVMANYEYKTLAAKFDKLFKYKE